LERRHFDLRECTVRVEGSISGRSKAAGPVKSKAGYRILALSPWVMEAVEGHLRLYVGPGQRARVVATSSGGPVARSNFSTQWRRSVVAAGLENMHPNVHLHDLRHWALTSLWKVASIRELMNFAGHSSPAAAMRYQQLASRDTKHLADVLGVALGSGSADADALDIALREPVERPDVADLAG